MPGAYAHLTMAMNNTNIDSLGAAGLPDEAAGQVLKHSVYVELGAISPDMPYLARFGQSERSNRWADLMHRNRTGARMRAGAAAVRDLAGDPTQAKAFAWLLGFASHVIFDVTMHPVVNLRVGGAYSPITKAEHQKCEMHQDVHLLVSRHRLASLSSAEIVRTGIAKLFHPGDDDRLDPVVSKVWNEMLRNTDDAEYEANRPDIDGWFEDFIMVMSSLEAADGLVSLGRHVMKDSLYPTAEDVDGTYVHGLATPGAQRMAYLEIYDKARGHVRDMWGAIHRAVLLGDMSGLDVVGPWNLDTGTNDDGSQAVVYWGGQHAAA